MAFILLKAISSDGGVTYQHVAAAPGPTLFQGNNPRFKYTLTNTGTTNVTGVTLTDSDIGTIISGITVAPGTPRVYFRTGTWAAGQQSNTATATGTQDGQPVTAADSSFYLGAVPDIAIRKEVSPDNGASWFEADTPPGPNIPQTVNPLFRYTVTNTGNVTLTLVSVTDNVLGPISVGGTLEPGACAQFVETGTWASGQQSNTATATGVAGGTTVSDTDTAHYMGVMVAMTFTKDISINGGTTWLHEPTPPGPNVLSGTNPMFRYTVTNTGDTSVNVDITDSVLGVIVANFTLLPSVTVEFFDTGTWAEGQQANTATATASAAGITITETDMSHYVGVVPAISLIKEVSPDNGLTWFDANVPPGPVVVSGISPRFRYTVTNTGTITLTDVDITDTVLGPIASGITLAPSETQQLFEIGTWALGQQMNSATAIGTADDATVSDTDVSYYLGEMAAPGLTLEKLVSFDQGLTFVPAGTPPGPTVLQGINPVFRYIITDTGNTPLFDVTLTDGSLGPITLPTTHLLPGESTTVDVTGTWHQGEQGNLAEATAMFDGETFAALAEAFYFGQISAVPIFPNLAGPAPQPDIIDRLLETIALEELSLSALMNAESMKVQAAVLAGVAGPVDSEDVVGVNSSVHDVMCRVVAKEQALYRKLERILRRKETGM